MSNKIRRKGVKKGMRDRGVMLKWVSRAETASDCQLLK